MTYLVKSPINKNVNFIHVYATSENPTYTYSGVAAPAPFTRNQQFGGIIKPSTSAVSLSNGNVVLDTKDYIAWVPGSMVVLYDSYPMNIMYMLATYILYKNDVQIENQTFASNKFALERYSQYLHTTGSIAANSTTNDLGMATFSANAGDILSLKIELSNSNSSGSTSGIATVLFPGTDSQAITPSSPLTSIFLWEIEK